LEFSASFGFIHKEYADLFNRHLKHINIKNNVEITQLLAIPALLYGCKNWTVQKKHEGRLRDSKDNIF